MPETPYATKFAVERPPQIAAEQESKSLATIVDASTANPAYPAILTFAENMIERGYTTTDPTTAEEAFLLAQTVLDSAIAPESSTDPTPGENTENHDAPTTQEALQDASQRMKLWKVLLPLLREKREKGQLSDRTKQAFQAELGDWIDSREGLSSKNAVAGAIIGGVALMPRKDWLAYPLPVQTDIRPRYVVETEQGPVLAARRTERAQNIVGFLGNQSHTSDAVVLAAQAATVLHGNELSSTGSWTFTDAQQLFKNRILAGLPARPEHTHIARLNETSELTGTTYDTFKYEAPELGFPLARAEDIAPETLTDYYEHIAKQPAMLVDVSAAIELALATGDMDQLTYAHDRLSRILADPPQQLNGDELSKLHLWQAYMPAFQSRVGREGVTRETISSVRANIATTLTALANRDNIGTLGRLITTGLYADIALTVDPSWLLYPSSLRENNNQVVRGGTRYNHNGYLGYGGWKSPVEVTAKGYTSRHRYDPDIRRVGIEKLIPDSGKMDHMSQLMRIAGILAGHLAGRSTSKQRTELGRYQEVLQRLTMPEHAQ